MDEIGNLSGSVQTALLYIDNAAKDVRVSLFGICSDVLCLYFCFLYKNTHLYIFLY